MELENSMYWQHVDKMGPLEWNEMIFNSAHWLAYIINWCTVFKRTHVRAARLIRPNSLNFGYTHFVFSLKDWIIKYICRSFVNWINGDMRAQAIQKECLTLWFSIRSHRRFCLRFVYLSVCVCVLGMRLSEITINAHNSPNWSLCVIFSSTSKSCGHTHTGQLD